MYYLGLKHDFRHKIAREKLFFSCFFNCCIMPWKHWNQLILILLLKKIWNHESCCQLYYAISTKLKLDKRVILLSCREQTFLFTKKITFCRFIEPFQDYALNFQCTWLLNYRKITFIMTRARVIKKTSSKMFLQLWSLIWSAKFLFQ